MVKLAMAAFLPDFYPAVAFNQTDQLSDTHCHVIIP
jgi:hypothetical protein